MSWLKAGDVVKTAWPDKDLKKRAKGRELTFRVLSEIDQFRCVQVEGDSFFTEAYSGRLRKVSRGPATPVEGAELDDDGA